MNMKTLGASGLAAVAALALVLALPAPRVQAHEPTCAGLGGIAVHGEHVVGDYVTGTGGIFGTEMSWPPAGEVGTAIRDNGGVAVAGGPAAGGHFGVPGLAPGASFCNTNAHPNGFTTPSHFQP
jgi:hypothetical protein